MNDYSKQGNLHSPEVSSSLVLDALQAIPDPQHRPHGQRRQGGLRIFGTGSKVSAPGGISEAQERAARGLGCAAASRILAPAARSERQVVLRIYGIIRPLTPVHFKMKPTRIPAKRVQDYRRVPGGGIGEGGGDVAMVRPPAPYNITAEVYRGKRKTIGSTAFLGSNGGGGYIPFQREGDGRTPIKSIKTVSVPQMITNPRVSEKTTGAIDEGLRKRLEHHLKQEIKNV